MPIDVVGLSVEYFQINGAGCYRPYVLSVLSQNLHRFLPCYLGLILSSCYIVVSVMKRLFVLDYYHTSESLTQLRYTEADLLVSSDESVLDKNRFILRNAVIRSLVTTFTHTHTRLTALCPGLPVWAGTRKIKPIWILVKQLTERALASAGTCAGLQLTPDR